MKRVETDVGRSGWGLRLVAGGLLLAGALVAQEEPSPRPEGGRPKSPPEVAEARNREEAVKGTAGPERREAKLAAAAAWAKAAEAAGENAAQAAMARVREGELRSTAGDIEGAEKAWRAVLELQPEKRGAQALLELGDLARRRNQPVQALALYEDLIKRFPKAGARAEEARVWIGKLHLQAGRTEPAREAFLGVARATASVGRMAYVYDQIITAWLREGRIEDARQALAEGKAALERLGRLGPAQARAAARALETLRAEGRIERAEKAAGKPAKAPPAGNGQGGS